MPAIADLADINFWAPCLLSLISISVCIKILVDIKRERTKEADDWADVIIPGNPRHDLFTEQEWSDVCARNEKKLRGLQPLEKR